MEADMKYEILKPTCVACQEEIDTPDDCIMESLRLGIPIHTKCGLIVDRFLAIWEKAFGVKYDG